MNAYIHAIASDTSLTEDIKLLIPNPQMRRRMSVLLKQSVGAAMQCLHNAGHPAVDAIVTATAFGCLADSEQFLKNLLENDEQMLNPTPFIQSTFNTVGGQVALLCDNVSYNMTYTHRGHSFESAVLDTVTLLETGDASCVLLGAFDFKTPTLEIILKRMGWPEGYGEGAYFFLLSSNPDGALAQLHLPEFPAYLDKADLPETPVYFPTQSASSLYDLLAKGPLKKPVRLCHNYRDREPAVLLVSPTK
ncbi:MAG: beta-ketoacyl synthase chain length factor [Paludibacteraceae bacterium]|nr:beta-ketoacyl synthase chain length factor [Paludibacteraceae bacterium]